MPPSTDLPVWLQRSGSGRRRRDGGRGRGAAMTALALLLFAAGGGAGYLVALRRAAPPPAAPPPVCPPAVACLSPAPSTGGGGSTGAARLARHAKAGRAAPAALVPLPAGKPLEEGERTKALRAFAAERAPELRDCLDDPDRGRRRSSVPPSRSAPTAPSSWCRSWALTPRLARSGTATAVTSRSGGFPTELLRGEEKLLVNFVL